MKLLHPGIVQPPTAAASASSNPNLKKQGRGPHYPPAVCPSAHQIAQAVVDYNATLPTPDDVAVFQALPGCWSSVPAATQTVLIAAGTAYIYNPGAKAAGPGGTHHAVNEAAWAAAVGVIALPAPLPYTPPSPGFLGVTGLGWG